MSDNNEKQKTEKPVKVPRVFKKPIKKKKLEKKFVKYIEHKQDKAFLLSCFDLIEDKYVIRDNLTKADIKKIKDLLKWIKNNKKMAIKIVPLVFAGAIAAAIIIFFMVFANPLLSRALEIGLEQIFEAKADVRGFRLSLIKFEISMRSVTVANRDRPMRNLFELGRIRISLRPQAVLRGKIYIEEIRADDIRFGTERSVSGALPGLPPREKLPKEQRETPPIIDLQNFDAMALLNQEFEKLRTPKLYDEAINLYNETYAKWQGNVDEARAQVQGLQSTAQPLLNINVNDFRVSDINDIEGIRRLEQTIRGTINDVNTMVSTVQTAAETATTMVRSIEDDVNNAIALEQNARNAITDDLNYFRSFVDLSSGAALNFLEPVIRDILDDTIEQYIDYGLIALETLEALKANADARPPSEPKPEKERREVFRGRDVVYPVRAYPNFYLGVLASDITHGTWNGAFEIRDISSNPDITNRPVSLTVDVQEQTERRQRNISFSGEADLRTASTERFNVNIGGAGFPVSLGNQLRRIGINGFTGNTGFDVGVRQNKDNRLFADGNVNIRDAQVVDPRGTVAIAIGSAVSDVDRIDLGLHYTYNPGERDNFSITTNLLDLINQAVRRIAQAYIQRAMEELERFLRAKIDEYIGDRLGSRIQIEQLLDIARGDRAAAEQLRNSLTNKRNELENRLRNMAADAGQQLRDEAQRQADALRDEAQRQADAAREEAERRAEEAREEARRQAEQAARDALQDVAPGIELPGNIRLPFGR